MDIKFWIWLIIIVVSLIARASKKKPQAQAPAAPRKPFQDRHPETVMQEHEQKPAMTFEELLREIEGSKTPKADTTSPWPKDYRDYDDEVIATPAAKPLEDTQYDYRKQDRIYDIYEHAKKEAFERPSLEETLKLSDTDMKFGQFKKYQKQQPLTVASDFAKELRTPSGFKKAFIMSEIMQRRF